MKTGRTLQAIAAELERQVETRKDFIAPQGALEVRVVDGDVVLEGLNGGSKTIAPFAHKQFADHLEIPGRYYDRMLATQPELLAQNLNAWLQADGENKRMVRTLDGRVRAFLSSKFRPLDNYDLATAILPTLLNKNVQIMSAELTETRMFIKGIFPELSDTLPAGVEWGGHNQVETKLVSAITISNSDVGAGTLRVEPSVFTTWCTNLAILMAAAMKKYHVGRAGAAEEDFSVYTDATRQADDKAFFLKVKDITLQAFNEDAFRVAIDSIRNAGKDVLAPTADLPTVVEVAVRRLALPESTSGSILSLLARNGDLSRWGLSSAITETANTHESYEVATQLERAGGQMLALKEGEWRDIADAQVAA